MPDRKRGGIKMHYRVKKAVKLIAEVTSDKRKEVRGNGKAAKR